MSLSAVVLREFRENKVLPPVGLVLGLILLFKTFPEQTGFPGQTDLNVIVIILGLVMSVVLGFLLGAGLLGPDLQEGRAGFFLARPLSPSALLTGKLLAAFLLASISGFLLVLPSLIRHWRMVRMDGLVPLVLALIILTAILLGHALSIAFRDRGGWLLLDGILALNLVGGGWLVLWRLLTYSAFNELGPFFLILYGGTLAALLAGAYAQAHWGRTDLRRGHRALSLSMTSILLATGAVAWGWMSRIEHPTLAKLPACYVRQVGQKAPWMILSGTYTSYLKEPIQVLVNAESGRTQRVGGISVLSPSGTRAAGVVFIPQWPGEEGRPTVWVADLGPRSARLRYTSIRLGKDWATWLMLVLDEDGRRLACFGPEGLEVYDLDRESLLFRQKGLPGWHGAATFLDPDHLRAYLHPANDRKGPEEVFELDLQRMRWTRTGVWGLEGGRPVERNAKGDLVLGHSWREREKVATWSLLDGRSGELRQILSSCPDPARARWTFLSDGSLLGVECTKSGARLRHLDPSGLERWTADLEGAGPSAPGNNVSTSFGLEEAPGRLEVRVGWWDATTRRRLAYDVDLAARTVLRKGPGAGELRPPSRLWWGGDLNGPWPAGSWALRLRTGDKGGVGLVQPDGTLKNLVPGQKP